MQKWRYTSLRKILVRKNSLRAMIDPVDHYLFRLRLDSKNDPVREVDQVPNLKGKFILLRDDGTAFRHLFE